MHNVQVVCCGILNARRDELIKSKHQETQLIVFSVRVCARHGAGLDQACPMSFDCSEASYRSKELFCRTLLHPVVKHVAFQFWGCDSGLRAVNIIVSSHEAIGVSPTPTIKPKCFWVVRKSAHAQSFSWQEFSWSKLSTHQDQFTDPVNDLWCIWTSKTE